MRAVLPASERIDLHTERELLGDGKEPSLRPKRSSQALTRWSRSAPFRRSAVPGATERSSTAGSQINYRGWLAAGVGQNRDPGPHNGHRRRAGRPRRRLSGWSPRDPGDLSVAAELGLQEARGTTERDGARCECELQSCTDGR